MSQASSNQEEQIFRPTVIRSPWVMVLVVSAVLVTLLPTGLWLYYSFVQSRLAYGVGAAGLAVELGVGRIEIPADEVAAAGRLEVTGPVRRAMGAGLRGFQMGWYRMNDERVYRVTTAGRDLVFVDTAADAMVARPATRYVLSPDDPERFLELLELARSGAWPTAPGSAAAVVFRPVPGPRVLTDPLLLTAVVLTLSIAVVFPWLTFAGARGMHYRVGPQGVAIHHLGRRLYRWDSIRGVELLAESVPRFLRMFGASLPGYHAGLFTAGRLGSVRVYASSLKPPLVLLETTTGRVILDPDDVEGFLAAVDRYRGSHGFNRR